MSRREDEPAREVLDVVPTVMRFIRAEMRSSREPDLSVPQFRSLVYIKRSEGTSLTGVAEHLGLTAPSACKLVDGLEHRGLVTRRESAEDRRRLTLRITPEGASAVTSARAAAQKSLSRMLGPLDDAELATVTKSMSALRRVFTASRGLAAADSSGEGGRRKNGNH